MSCAFKYLIRNLFLCLTLLSFSLDKNIFLLAHSTIKLNFQVFQFGIWNYFSSLFEFVEVSGSCGSENDALRAYRQKVSHLLPERWEGIVSRIIKKFVRHDKVNSNLKGTPHNLGTLPPLREIRMFAPIMVRLIVVLTSPRNRLQLGDYVAEWVSVIDVIN